MKQILKRLRLKLSPSRHVVEMTVPSSNLQGLLPTDQFIVSYPRSGNTWLRHLLCDLILQQSFGVHLEGLAKVPSPDALMPDLHVHGLTNETQASYVTGPRIFKSHNLSHLRGRRMIYLFRSPADALVSYYHLNLRRPELRERAQAQGLESYCRSAFAGWRCHIDTALEYYESAPSEVLLLNYGRLLEDGVTELGRAAEFFGLARDEASLKAAISRCAFERLRKREEQNPKHPEEYFYRKGKQNSGREELSESTWSWIMERGDVSYDRATRLLEGSLSERTEAKVATNVGES